MTIMNSNNEVCLHYKRSGNSSLENKLLNILTGYGYNISIDKQCYSILIKYSAIYQVIDEVTQLLLDNIMAPNYIQGVRRELYKLATSVETGNK